MRRGKGSIRLSNYARAVAHLLSETKEHASLNTCHLKMRYARYPGAFRGCRPAGNSFAPKSCKRRLGINEFAWIKTKPRMEISSSFAVCNGEHKAAKPRLGIYLISFPCQWPIALKRWNTSQQNHAVWDGASLVSVAGFPHPTAAEKRGNVEPEFEMLPCKNR